MWGPRACPVGSTLPLNSEDPHMDISQQDEDNGTEQGVLTEVQGDEGKHKAPTLPLLRPRSLQDTGDIGDAGSKGGDSVDTLLTGGTVVILGYIILATTVFMPGYAVWGVWVVALRRFDLLSRCVLLLSCSALLYYPLQRLASNSANILLPLCVFGIPFVYLIVQRYIFAGRIERKNVLT